MKPVHKTENLFTYKDYLSWNDNKRWELIDGIAYDMSPAPSRSHQRISIELCRQLSTHLLDKSCQVYSAPFDVRLPKQSEPEIDTVVQPDISVVCDNKKLDDKGCIGAPDIIIEITSPNTASKDLKEKFVIYEKHGVKEYWIIHPAEKTVLVFKLDDKGRYGKPDTYTSEDRIKVVSLDNLEIDLSTVFRD